jgi:epoxyqueuosine reductase
MKPRSWSMATKVHADLSPLDRADRIKRRALELGFQRCGITDLSPTPHGDALSKWLRAGMAGSMTYMHRQETRRREPSRILERATRAVVVTWNYHNGNPEWSTGTGKVASYARGTDYHAVLREPLQRLADCIHELGDEDTVAKWYVDAGPVPERELAQRAGLGWIGKNTMLLDPSHGSFFFIAVVLTNLDLSLDVPFDADRCGTCRRCLDACPTDAFPAERILDGRLCISYLTIEHRGSIDVTLGRMLNGWVFGCDDCQTVCPWNIKFAGSSIPPQRDEGEIPAELDLIELAELSAEEFEKRFAHSPLTRSGINHLKQTARLLLRNSADPSG